MSEQEIRGGKVNLTRTVGGGGATELVINKIKYVFYGIP